MDKLESNATTIRPGMKILPKDKTRPEYLKPLEVTMVVNQGTYLETLVCTDGENTFRVSYREYALVPEVGMPVTYSCWTDQYPGTVMEVSKSGKTMKVRPDRYEYAGRPGMGGPGGLDSNTWEYYPGAGEHLMEFRLTKTGDWKLLGGGYHAGIGWRRYYHDYSF